MVGIRIFTFSDNRNVVPNVHMVGLKLKPLCRQNDVNFFYIECWFNLFVNKSVYPEMLMYTWYRSDRIPAIEAIRSSVLFWRLHLTVPHISKLSCKVFRTPVLYYVSAHSYGMDAYNSSLLSVSNTLLMNCQIVIFGLSFVWLYFFSLI